MSWNPGGNTNTLDTNQAIESGTQPFAPATGVDENQGALYPPGYQEIMQRPQAMGVNQLGFLNPYSLTFYSFPLNTTSATRCVPANYRRTYLILQNQGPGNIYLNFGQDVTIATASTNSNGIQLIQTQVYEMIGGGDVDNQGNSRAFCFVSPDYISGITDTAGTTLLVGEGVWQYRTAPGQSY